MADFYKTKDVRELMKFRRILLIGDSNVRPLYKDLLGALSQKRLTSTDILKNSDVDSYFGDIAIQQCGKQNTWSFWENRIYEKGGCRVEMFSTGQLLIDVIKGFYRKLVDKSSSVPDIVYLSYSPTHWKNSRHSLFDLMVDLKFTFPCNTLFIVGSGFPTTTDSFGDPIFDDVPYFTKCSIKNNEQINMTIIDKTASLGFIYLNFAFYLRKGVFRGIAVQPGWESVVARYTTFLFLTCIAQNLLIKVPGRVDQELFTKAIASTREDLDDYRLLLLKLSNNWIDVKSKVPVDEQADPAAKNAKEILEKLWKLHHHSKNHSRKGRSDNERRRSNSNKRHKAMSDRQLSNIVSSILPKSIDSEILDPESVGVVSKSDQKRKNPAETDPTVGVQGECDAESLEEGEIRDSPCTSRSKSPSGELQNSLLLSDITTSDGEMNEEDDTESVAPGTTITEIQSHRKELTSWVAESSVCNSKIQNTLQSIGLEQALGSSSTSYNCPYPFTIEVSDEETPADGSGEAVMTYKSHEDVVINLDSGDSDVETGTLSGKEVIPNNNPTQIAINNSCPFSKSPFKKQNQLICESKNMNAGLYMKNENGDSLAWPADVDTVNADYLWKWWRRHIENNSYSVVICPEGWPQVVACIPTLTKGNIAVPKVIDDIKLFFHSLKDIKFSEDCLVDCSYNVVDDIDEDQNVQAVEPLPSVTELSGRSEKRVHFRILPRGALKSSLPAAQISVCSFASYRHVMSRQSGVVPGALDIAPTEQPTTSSTEHQPTSQSSAFHFYGYGEHMNLPKAASPAHHCDPLCFRVETPSKSTRNSPESLHVKTGGASSVQRGYSKKSVDDRKRKRDRSRSTSPPVMGHSPRSPIRRQHSMSSMHPKKRIHISFGRYTKK